MAPILKIREQKEILRLKRLGRGRNAIARITHHSRSTVGKILARGKSIRTRQITHRLGRPPIITPAIIRKAKREAKLLRVSRSKDLTSRLQLKCSVRTAQKLLRLTRRTYCKKKLKPPLTKEVKRQRLDFAERHLRDDALWNCTVFTDEKKFNLDGPDNTRMGWYTKEERQEYDHQSFDYHKSVMVWAGVGVNFKTPIVFIDRTLDSQGYISLLKSHLLPAVRPVFNYHWRLVQDGASAHRSLYSTQAIKEMGIARLEWPSHSPDLNIIENVWHCLSQRVFHDGQPKPSVVQLKSDIVQAWNDIPMSTINSLVFSMTDRLRNVVRSEGGSTHY